MTINQDLSYYRSLKYKVELFFSKEDNRWFARLPELGEVLADSATPKKALEKVLKLKNEVLESDYEQGLPIPEPLPEVEYSGRFLTRVPKSLHQRLAEEAEREGTSINRLMIQLLSEALERRQNKQATTDEIRDSVRGIIQEMFSSTLPVTLTTEETPFESQSSKPLVDTSFLRNFGQYHPPLTTRREFTQREWVPEGRKREETA